MKKVIAISGTHGCFGKNTEIRMFDGTIKYVQDIMIGDTLMGDNSTPRKVLALKEGEEELFEFEYIDGIKHIYNKSHELVLQYSQTCKSGTTKRPLKNQTTGDTRIITVKDYLKLGKQKQRILCKFSSGINRTSLEKLKIPSYILGVWLGDGTSSRPEVTNIDDCIIEELAKFAEKENLMLVQRGKGSITYGLVTALGKENPFLNNLKFYNLINNKHVPLDYFNSNINDRLELLAGLIDTDGYLDKRSRRVYTVVQKNKALAYDIFYLVRSCGIHSTIRKVQSTCTNNNKTGTYYSISISRNIEKIPCKLERKKAQIINNAQRKSSRVGIKKITSLGKGAYYGFTLDSNNLFLHADSTVLKNTGKTYLAYNLCIFLKKQGKNVIVLDELARTSPFEINQTADDNTQVWIMCNQVVKELELMDKYDYLITDRSVLDAYCYGKVLENTSNNWTYTYLMEFLAEHIKKYYKKLYLLDPNSFNYNVEDGIRDTDESFRKNVHTELTSVFECSTLNYKLIRNELDVYSDFILD